MSEPVQEVAVYLAAAANGANAGALLDSAAFRSGLEALEPNTAGYVERVSQVVRVAVEEDPGRFSAAVPAPLQAPAAGRVTEPAAAPEQRQAPPRTRNEQLAYKASRRAALTADYGGEVSLQDVQDADPRVVGEWAASGKLTALGVPAQKHRPYRR
jgi:hypothetical protein